MNDKGLFIVFEGIDGGGKSTQIKMLAEYFKDKGYQVEFHMEPTEGSVGSLLWTYMRSKDRSFTPETEALLFAADRMLEQLMKVFLNVSKEGMFLFWVETHMNSDMPAV